MDVSARKFHVQVVVFRGMAIILCNDNFCAAFLSVSVFPFKRCLLLLASHCLMSTILYPALNDWPFMKYASNYCAPSACLLVLYYPPLAELAFAHARFYSHLFPRLV